MLDIGGKPMIQWVLDALGAAEMVDHVVVVGLPPFTDLTCKYPLTVLTDQGGLMENIHHGAAEVLRQNAGQTHALVVSVDIPAITGEMVDCFASQVADGEADFYLNVIERTVLEDRFPNSQRSFTHLKGMQVCAGDLYAFRLALAVDDRPIWRRLAGAQHSSLKQASLLGYDTLFFIFLRQLTLQEAARVVSKRLGIEARAVLCPFAEIGMDVDKPAQLDILRAELGKLQGL